MDRFFHNCGHGDGAKGCVLFAAEPMVNGLLTIGLKVIGLRGLVKVLLRFTRLKFNPVNCKKVFLLSGVMRELRPCCE